MPATEIVSFDTHSSRVVGGQSIDCSCWATPDEGALEGNQRRSYLRRKHAISLFLAGASASTVKELTSLSAKQAYRLIRERCLKPHPDGQPYGWRALVPYERIQPYTRKKSVRADSFGNGAAGALQALLNTRPDLRAELDARIRPKLGAKKRLKEVHISKRRHWKWFIDKLRDLGYEARGEWPFNTQTRAYYSIVKYVDNLLASDPVSLAAVTGGPDLVTKLKTGDGVDRPILSFMQRAEMDAHKLDGRFCVVLPTIDGGVQEKIVHRLWVVVILEVMSRVVLGYYFSLRREISQEDVLRAMKRALTRWVLRPVTFCDKAYVSGAGLLSTRDDNFIGLCWDETSVDGALAEASKRVRAVLLDAIGSKLLEPKNSFSKRRSKDDRPFIENFFRHLASGGLQRLSNTTGGKTEDRKGTNPEEVAVASRFQFEYAEELLDVLIANYNATPNKGIGYRKPLDYAEFLYKRSEKEFRKVEYSAIDNFLSIRKLCVVRGGAKKGRAPYVEFFYGRYSNEILQNRQDLVGKKIWVINHIEDDARIAKASTINGESLGVLRAAPPWSTSPHSLSVRAAIEQASSRGYFLIEYGSDAIANFMNYVESQPKKKLPVHPSYLEARRILSAAASPFISDAKLNEAMARADEVEEHYDNKKILKKTKENKPLVDATASIRDKPLPPRRMAKSE